MFSILTPALNDRLVALGMKDGSSLEKARTFVAQKLADGTIDEAEFKELCELGSAANKLRMVVKDAIREELGGGSPRRRGGAMTEALGFKATTGGQHIRVKDESEKYSDHSYYLKHNTGDPVFIDDGPVYAPSDRAKRRAGVWFKQWLRKQTIGAGLPPLDAGEQQILVEMSHDSHFCGVDENHSSGGWTTGRKLFDYERKSLVNDTTSGGAYLVPQELDELLIATPLVLGQVFPFVDLRSASRDKITTPNIAHPSILWSDSTDTGSPATLFDSADLVNEVETNFFPISCFLPIGRDWLSDQAFNAESVLQNLIGESLQRELDRVVILGNGTTQPLGVVNASVTSVPSANGIGGPLTVSDMQRMWFGVGRAHREPSMRVRFAGTDTTYSRFRGIPVGTNDQRTVLGFETQADYNVMTNVPYGTVQQLADNQLVCGAWARYRCWRRMGFEFFLDITGSTNRRQNQALLGVRGRFGGRPLYGSAFTYMADAAIMDS